MKFKDYWKYIKYILEHKKNVFKVCWSKGMYKHAILHDMSKFHPKEFFAYAEWFLGPHGIKLKNAYTEEQITNGESILSKNYLACKERFDRAWEHHYKNNPHHWNYWVREDGEPDIIPEKYLDQMIADWEAMGIKFGNTAQEFYLKNYKKINLHVSTRIVLEMKLFLNDSPIHNYAHTLEQFAEKYDEKTYNNHFGYIKEKYGIDTYKLFKS